MLLPVAITLKNAACASHCLQLLPNLSSIGTRGCACDAHRPDVLASVILGIGLLGLVLPSIRLFGGDGRNRTYGVSDVTDLQSAAFAARHTSPKKVGLRLQDLVLLRGSVQAM
jgi:hypothetical protein